MLSSREDFVAELRPALTSFSAPVALEIDTTLHHNLQLSDHATLVQEVTQMLDAWPKSEIPMVPKVSLAVPVDVAMAIESHPHCEGLSVQSGIPWGGCADRIDWEKMFGSNVSPLQQEGNGELFGEPCMPILKDWLIKAKKI